MTAPRPGRRALTFAAALAALAIGAWTFQLLILKSVVMPWYVAILGAGAVVLATLAFVRSPSLGRGLVTLLIVALGGAEVYFVLSGSKLPRYEGPVAVGAPFPAFAAERATGVPFTDADLRGQPTVLTFFRGRW